MLIGPPESGFGWLHATHPTPNTTSTTQHGVLVTSGSTPSEGAWVELIDGAAVPYDICRTWLWLCDAGSNAQTRQCVLDVGIDPTAGTSYTEIISELTCGTSGAKQLTGRHFWFPIRIPAGASVAVRIRGDVAFTQYVGAVFYGRPRDPSRVWCAKYSETIGKASGVLGTVLAGATPVGVSGAKGTVQSLGSSAKRLQFFQLGAQVNDTTANPRTDWWDVFAGTGTDLGRDAVIRNMRHMQLGSTEVYNHGLELTAYKDCPAGTAFYARAATSLATADSNYNCTLLGFGG